MIQAEFTSRAGRMTMTVTGHAGSAPRGRDLVCAAASILACTAAAQIRDLAREDKLREAPVLVLEEGSARICACPRQEALPEALGIFRVVAGGFRLLAASFPRFVALREDTDSSPYGQKGTNHG